MEPTKDPRSNAAIIGGGALILFGAWLLVRTTGLIPIAVLDLINGASGALTLIVIGVLVVVFTRRGTIHMPPPGTRLYKSRGDRWIGGVIGGLGTYFGVDPILLRIAAILLVVLGAGWIVLAYIVMLIVVPEEPYPFPGGPVPPSY